MQAADHVPGEAVGGVWDLLLGFLNAVLAEMLQTGRRGSSNVLETECLGDRDDSDSIRIAARALAGAGYTVGYGPRTRRDGLVNPRFGCGRPACPGFHVKWILRGVGSY